MPRTLWSTLLVATAAQAQGIGLLPISYMTMIAAATAFSTPIGFQTNLMVYGPGSYRLRDFVKMGVPMNLLLWGITTGLAPLVWPFR